MLQNEDNFIAVEEMVALLAGTISFINEVLPVVTFWWRLVSLILFIVLVMDLSLRSRLVIAILPLPYKRLLASFLVFGLVIAMLWTPMRKQYLAEHMPPSFIYIVPGAWFPAPVPQWLLMIRHYGPLPIHNIELLLVDQDRAKLTYGRDSIAPEDIAKEQITLKFAEIDPTETIEASAIRWVPLNPDHEHFDAAITSREGDLMKVSELNASTLGNLRTG